MASNNCSMMAERLDKLKKKLLELDPYFKEARTALFAAKDRDDLFTNFLESDMFEEACDKAEEYGFFVCFQCLKLLA